MNWSETAFRQWKWKAIFRIWNCLRNPDWVQSNSPELVAMATATDYRIHLVASVRPVNFRHSSDNVQENCLTHAYFLVCSKCPLAAMICTSIVRAFPHCTVDVHLFVIMLRTHLAMDNLRMDQWGMVETEHDRHADEANGEKCSVRITSTIKIHFTYECDKF